MGRLIQGIRFSSRAKRARDKKLLRRRRKIANKDSLRLKGKAKKTFMYFYFKEKSHTPEREEVMKSSTMRKAKRASFLKRIRRIRREDKRKRQMTDSAGERINIPIQRRLFCVRVTGLNEFSEAVGTFDTRTRPKDTLTWLRPKDAVKSLKKEGAIRCIRQNIWEEIPCTSGITR